MSKIMWICGFAGFEIGKFGSHRLADDIGALSAIGATPDITRLSTESKKPLDMVAGAYFAASRTIG